MGEGFPDDRSPSSAQRMCLRDRLAHTNKSRTTVGALTPRSRLHLSPRSTCRSSPRLSTKSLPARKADGATIVLSGARPVSSETPLGDSLSVGPLAGSNRQADEATSPLSGSRPFSKATSPLPVSRLVSSGTPLGGSLSVGLSTGSNRQADEATSPLSGSRPVSKATSPLPGSRPVSSGIAPFRGSLRVGWFAAGNNRRATPASSAEAHPETIDERRRQQSTSAQNFPVPTRPKFEDTGPTEKNIAEVELEPQFESISLAEVGDGTDLAPKQQKPLNVEEAVHATLEVVWQEHIARARDMSEIQTKITSQQEWFAKELSRHTMQSVEALAPTENPRLSRLETQVEAMRNQIDQTGEARSRERAQGEAHEISEPTFASVQTALLSGPHSSQYVPTLMGDRVQQAHARSRSRSSPVQEAIASSPELAQYVQKLVDDRVQQVLNTQLTAEILQNLINTPSTSASLHKAILSCPGLSQHVQTLVDDRVQQAVDGQFDAELEERFNSPFTLALVQKAIFSSSCLSQHVNTMVDVRVQQVADATHELNKELHAFAARLQEEREIRAKSIHDLHSKLASETASIRAHVERTNLCLQEASAKDRRSQTEELAEVRAILDTVWARASQVKGSNSQRNFFKCADSSAGGEPEDGSYRYKECVGDAEDINTLYEMVREAVGNSEMMKREIQTGKDKRNKDRAAFQRELQQMEARLQKLILKIAEGLPKSDH